MKISENGYLYRATFTNVAGKATTETVTLSAGSLHNLAFGEGVPTVSAVSPAVGPLTGNTTVTITGKELSGATAVSFGANPGRILTVSPTSITAESPPGAVGTINVVVATAAATSVSNAHTHFKYKK